MSAGTLSRSGTNLSFLVARSEGGAPNAIPTNQEESITTPGVDGKRWRIIFRQYEPTDLYTVIDCATSAYAVSTKAQCEALKGQLCRLTVSIGGVDYSFKDVHVEGVKAVAFPGPAVGNGATGLSHVVAVFTIIPTNYNANSLGN